MEQGEHDEMPFDLHDVSLLTGIYYPHLVKMLRGDMEPSESHYNLLVELLGAEHAGLFNYHDPVVPSSYLALPKGQMPDGTVLVPQTLSADLQEGDYLQYKFPRRNYRIVWLLVEEVETEDNLVYVTCQDDFTIDLKADIVLSVARPASRVD